MDFINDKITFYFLDVYEKVWLKMSSLFMV